MRIAGQGKKESYLNVFPRIVDLWALSLHLCSVGGASVGGGGAEPFLGTPVCKTVELHP